MMADEMLDAERRGMSRELREDLAQGALVLAALIVLNVLTFAWLPFLWSLVLALVYGLALALRATAGSEATD